jgi:hypothetical protein
VDLHKIYDLDNDMWRTLAYLRALQDENLDAALAVTRVLDEAQKVFGQDIGEVALMVLERDGEIKRKQRRTPDVYPRNPRNRREATLGVKDVDNSR